jgi:putative hemolysin
MIKKYAGKIHIVATIIIVLLLVLVGFFFWNKAHAENAISGTVEFTGTLPGDDVEGDVLIEAREHGGIGFEEVEAIDMWDDLDWIWDGPERGKNYDIRARLVIDGDEVSRSNIVQVTAPAQDEELQLDLSLENLPENLQEDTANKHGEYVNLSGDITIHGYIPANSYVKVYTKTADGVYEDIKGEFDAKKGTKWGWDSAKAGTRYTIVAQLVDAGGHVVGESKSLHVSAPASGQTLIIESHANHSNKSDGSHHKATISGNIDLNGPINKHTSIRVLYRLPGEKDFKLADKIDAKDGEKWEWKNAQSGQRYEMTACYAENDKCQSVSHHQFVNAPAKKVKFKVNTELSLHKPHHKPELKGCVKNGNKYTARIEIPHEKEARSYWVQVGSRSGYHDVYNHKKDRGAHDDSFEITVDVDPGKHYYAQYAWAHCHDNCDDDNFSHFSHNLKFSCGEEGEKVAKSNPKAQTHTDNVDKASTQAGTKGYKWDANKKACVETDDKNAPYAHTNAGLEQCQKTKGKTGNDANPNVINNIDNSVHSATTDSHNVTNNNANQTNSNNSIKASTTKNTTQKQQTNTSTPKSTASQKSLSKSWVKEAKKKCKDSGGHMIYEHSKNGDEYRVCKLDAGHKCAAKALVDGSCSLTITTSADAPQDQVDEVTIATKEHAEVQNKAKDAEKQHKKALEEHKKAIAEKKDEAKKKVNEAKEKLEQIKKEVEAKKQALEEKKKKAQAKKDADVATAKQVKKEDKINVQKEAKMQVQQKTTDMTHEAAQACVVHGGISTPKLDVNGVVIHPADEALGVCTMPDGSVCTNADVLQSGICPIVIPPANK